MAFFFTALVVAPMFFLTPVTITSKGVGVSIAEAAWWSCLYNTVDCVQFLTGNGDNCGTLGWRCATRDLMELILVRIPAFFFGLAGIVFDVFIAFSLSSTIIQNQDFVNKGWVIMRDLSNTFFIFILLYIAIATILQTAGGQTKRLLATLVVVALFMNFSLYITKFVIDVGNVFALEFYVNMGVLNQSYITLNDIQPRSISFAFNDAFKIQKLFGPDFLTQAADNLPLTAFIFTLVGIMYMVAAFVFLTAGWLFLARVVAFWFLMILSPLAFFSYILPFTRGKIWSRWSSELVNQTFFAPIFLFFIYLTLMLAGTVNTLFKQGNPLTGDMSFLQTVFISFLTFFALITTLLFGLKTAKSMSGAMGESMLKIGGTVTGAAVGAGAWVGRNTGGRLARYANDKLGSDLEKTRFGRGVQSGLNTVSSSSFDARASKIGQMAQTTVGGINLGAAGGQGGHAGVVGAKQKDLADHTKKLLAKDPAAAASYLATHEMFGATRDTAAAMASMTYAQRAELIANAKPGKERDRLVNINKALGEGTTDKQKKQEALETSRYKNTEAKDVVENFEGLKTEQERKDYVNTLVNGDPSQGKAGLDKDQRLALMKNMTAAQREEAEAMNNQIFAGIIKETDLTKEELSRITDQNKKYKDTQKENTAKVAQEGRVNKIKTIMDEYDSGRGRDLAILQTEAAAHIRDMNDNEVAALEAAYLTNKVVAPHITKGVLAKVEKGDKVKLTVGQKEDFYKNLKENNPEMKKYIEERESVGAPSDGARRRFRGGRDNRNQGTGGGQTS
jgi:hypothetical protein